MGLCFKQKEEVDFLILQKDQTYFLTRFFFAKKSCHLYCACYKYISYILNVSKISNDSRKYLTKICIKFKKEISNCFDENFYSMQHNLKDILILRNFSYNCSYLLITKIPKDNIFYRRKFYQTLKLLLHDFVFCFLLKMLLDCYNQQYNEQLSNNLQFYMKAVALYNTLH